MTRSRWARRFRMNLRTQLIIAFGVVFLLNTLELVRLHEILRFWPVFLIALGGYMLYLRVTDRGEATPVQAPAAEVRHES